jgi:folate-binding protein YgfZ
MQPFFPEHYRALREAAALVDRSHRGRIAAVGSDRLSYLHAMLTNDIAALGPGRGCYAAYLTPQGRMIADMRVLELGDLTLLDVEASAKAVVLEKLEQFIFSEDVRVADLSSDLGEISIYGPRAADAVAAALASEGGAPSADVLAALAEYASVRAPFKGGAAVITADRDLGVPGFTAYIDRERAPALEAAVREAGAVEIGEDAAEVLRIEAGRPRYGVDMDENTIPLEAGIENRAISFTKGCYPGQEVITRVLHRGHGRIARKLVGMVVEGGATPARGDRVVSGDTEVGTVTSAAMSPSLQSPIALGYVQRDFVEPGTDVSIVHGDTRLSAKTTGLPFVRP